MQVSELLAYYPLYLHELLFTGGLKTEAITLVHFTENGAHDLDEPSFSAAVRARPITMLHGWPFAASKSFTRRLPDVRKCFTIRPQFRAAAEAREGELRSRCDKVIGVHVRRGDYSTWLGGKYCYSVAQYIAILQRIPEIPGASRYGFLVCSNEDLSELAATQLIHATGIGTTIEDFYALSLCDLVIGPPSTFSDWACMLGDKPRFVIKHAEDEVPASFFGL